MRYLIKVIKLKRELSKIMQTIKKMINDKDFIAIHRHGQKDFVRTHELSFADIVSFVLGKTGNPLDLETMRFCQTMCKKVSAPAVCKARDKINYTAFKELLQQSNQVIPPKNLYRGYRLTSADGMIGELPRTPELMEKYRHSKGSLYPQFCTIATYDVLNCVYTNAVFAPAPANERTLFYSLLEEHTYDDKEIFLLDRGFPSVKLIQQMEKRGKSFVMRAPGNFLKEVDGFGKIQSKDKTIHINYDKARKRANRVDFEGDVYAFDLRLVKIDLPKGKSEILITNLPKTEFTRLDIGELYNFRWRIETAFLDLKYAVHVEEFISKKENSIKQEFYASLIQANLAMLFMETANQVVLSKKKRCKSWIMW